MITPNTANTPQRLRYLAADLITGEVAFWVFNIIRFFLLNESDGTLNSLWVYLGSAKLVVEQCVVPPAMLIIYWLSGYYNQPFNRSRLQEFTTTFWSSMLNTVIIYLVLLINDQTGKRLINYEMIIILFGLLWVITYLGRLVITDFTIRRFKKEIWQINVLIIGNSEVSRKLASELRAGNRNYIYHIMGFVELPGEQSVKDGEPVIPFKNLQSSSSELKIDQLILAPQFHDDKKVMELLSVLFPLEIPVKISPDTFSFVTSAIRMNDIFGEPFIDLTSPSISECAKNIKRTFDVIASGLILIILSPLFAVIAVLIKLNSKGPVIYSQERIGKHQIPFKIYKFRTMVVDAEKEGPRLSSEDDPRITSIGKQMRKYRLDELPQFWNVFKGDMSIVGPRPEREFYVKQIVKEAPYYTLVCQVRPGITSWGMVKYGYASTVAQMVERTRFDLIYLANMSLSVDCKIMIYTIKTVVGGEGM